MAASWTDSGAPRGCWTRNRSRGSSLRLLHGQLFLSRRYCASPSHLSGLRFRVGKGLVCGPRATREEFRNSLCLAGIIKRGDASTRLGGPPAIPCSLAVAPGASRGSGTPSLPAQRCPGGGEACDTGVDDLALCSGATATHRRGQRRAGRRACGARARAAGAAEPCAAPAPGGRAPARQRVARLVPRALARKLSRPCAGGTRRARALRAARGLRPRRRAPPPRPRA